MFNLSMYPSERSLGKRGCTRKNISQNSEQQNSFIATYRYGVPWLFRAPLLSLCVVLATSFPAAQTTGDRDVGQVQSLVAFSGMEKTLKEV